MNDPPNLVTPFTFKEKLFLIKMYVTNGNILDLSVTDKHTAEEWRNNYDASYIENLTHKTGNYKQFDVFVTMLRSGLLKTSECVSLDLLTVEDLESLRSRRLAGKTTCGPPRSAAPRTGNLENRRYLILTYSVEFDRIHYPLPLEYCGPPDPQVLQGIIRKLEADVERLQEQLNAPDRAKKESREEVIKLQKRVEELSSENKSLIDEVRQLNKKLSKRLNSYEHMENMQTVMKTIEEQVIQERTAFQRLLQKLRDEKSRLQKQVDQLRASERSLRTRLRFSCSAAAPRAASPATAATGARPPGDGLSPGAAASAAARARHAAPGNAGRASRSAAARTCPPARLPIASPRKSSSCNQHILFHSRSAACCPSVTRKNRSSSESSCHSRKPSPQKTKLSAKISSKSFHPNYEQQRKLKSDSVPQHKYRSERNRIKNAIQLHRSCSECSSCSYSQNCTRRDRSGSWSTSGSSKPVCLGSGDQKRNRRPTNNGRKKQTKDAKRGISDLEDRIKALQRLLKEGLPLK